MSEMNSCTVNTPSEKTDEAASERAIITVLGADRSGIVSAVSGVLASQNVNILDISQTILQGIFTMTMLVDLACATNDFSDTQKQLSELATKLDLQITMQREDVFKFIYRLSCRKL